VRRFPTSFRFAIDIVAHNLLTIKGKSKKIVPLKTLDKNVNFGPISKKIYFWNENEKLD